MSTLIGLTGRAQHGKDTVAAALGYKRFAFADKLKQLALLIDPIVGARVFYSIEKDIDHENIRLSKVLEHGAEEAKRVPEVRRFYQHLGTDARTVLGPNVWVDAIRRDVERELRYGHNVVISDVRFPNEAEMVHALGGKVVRIVRPGFDNGVDPLHPSEAQVDDLGHDLTLTNDEDLTMLKEAAKRLPRLLGFEVTPRVVA